MNPGSDDNFARIDSWHPESVEELSRLLQAAHESSVTGQPADLDSSGMRIQQRLQGLAAIVDYPAGDMTITVQAGMSRGALRAVLADQHQQLPVDEYDDTVSLGELVAADISGPRSYGYGALRDYVIGIQAVDGTGRVFHAGGRVVKNVAGYDFCRLLTGAQGRFAVITQLTFKLKPRPERQNLLVLQCEDWSQVAQVLERINTSAAMPVIVDVWNGLQRAEPFPAMHLPVPSDEGTDTSAFVVLGVDGTPSAVDWQQKTLLSELKGLTPGTFLGDDDLFQEYCRSATYPRSAPTNNSELVCVATLPSRVTDVVRVLTENGLSAVARAGTGTIFVSASAGQTSQPFATAVRQLLAEALTDSDSSVFALDDEPANLSGMSPQERQIVLQIARQLDPSGVLMPRQEATDCAAETGV